MQKTKPQTYVMTINILAGHFSYLEDKKSSRLNLLVFIEIENNTEKYLAALFNENRICKKHDCQNFAIYTSLVK